MCMWLNNIFSKKEKAEVISHVEVNQLLRQQLSDRLRSNVIIILADANYCLIKSTKVQEIYANSNIKNLSYEYEKHDCDDFSVLMKAEFIKAVKKDSSARYAYAAGIVFGNIPTPHAINWYIDENKKIWFIEPQNGDIFAPKGKNIVFLYS
jgi:hypothetical protein